MLSVLLTVLISETANRLIKPASLNSIDEDNQLSFGQGHYYVNVLKDYIHDRNFTIVTL